MVMIEFIAKYSTVDKNKYVNLFQINGQSFGLDYYENGEYIYTEYFPEKNINQVKYIANKFIISCSQTKVKNEL